MKDQLVTLINTEIANVNSNRLKQHQLYDDLTTKALEGDLVDGRTHSTNLQMAKRELDRLSAKQEALEDLRTKMVGLSLI